MQFNQATDYAFRAVLHLAQLPPDTVVNGQTLATKEAIPSRFLLKIMRTLIQAGLVRSYRGVEGGFGLARAADEISLLDIVQAMEGPVAVHRCLADRQACNKHCCQECPIHAALGGLQETFVDGLRCMTMTKLIKQQRKAREVIPS